jgi:outer membrane protein insertion porin family
MGTRYLETNQSLVIKKAEIVGLNGSLKTETEKLIANTPNSRLFSFIPIAYLAHAYELGQSTFNEEKVEAKKVRVENKYARKIDSTENEKRKTRLLDKKTRRADELKVKLNQGNWLMRTGETLSVLDTSKCALTLMRINTYLSTNGYFNTSSVYSVIDVSKTKKRLRFDIDPREPFIIDSIHLDIDDDQIKALVNLNQDKSPIKKAQRYGQNALDDERNRIYDLLSNNGYFDFDRQYTTFVIDTITLSDNKILLTKKISKPADGNHKQFTVDSIIFYVNESTKAGLQSETYLGNSYQFGKILYSPKILHRRLAIKKDSIYSRALTIKTQKQLSFLDAFRFVNINYDSINDHSLIANIFTRPLDRFQTTMEVGAVSASQQLPGPFVNLGLKKRNALGSLETFDLQGNFSVQGISNVENETSQYTLFQYGASATLVFPRFIFPFFEELKSKIDPINPQTQTSLSYNYEDRASEYKRAIVEFGLLYRWQNENQSQFTFSPITFSYIDVRDINDQFRDFLDEQLISGNGALDAAFRSSVISNTSFEALFNFDNSTKTNESSFLRLFMETGGNLINLLGEDFFTENRILDTEDFSLFRWAKVQADYRRTISLNRKSDLAFRVNAGYAFPYGPEPSMPYEKRFYIGGSNSIRAWPVRRLGPGSYGLVENIDTMDPSLDLINFDLEQGGDMILEASIEFRRNLIGFVDYALFVDAGNIWLTNSNFNLNDETGDNGFFKLSSFYREIAIGAGAGLRLDFSFFVFRLDAAVQVHDPGQLPGQRWVIDQVPFGKIGNLTPTQRSILQNKTNITLGIGLPF